MYSFHLSLSGGNIYIRMIIIDRHRDIKIQEAILKQRGIYNQFNCIEDILKSDIQIWSLDGSGKAKMVSRRGYKKYE